jgi:anti-sigma factor RsiW
MSERPITEDALHAYVDNALDEARRAEVAAYLKDHPQVAARVKSYEAQRGSLRSALDPIADEPIPANLNLAHLIERRSRPQPSWRPAAAAAAVFLTIGLSGGWFLRGMVAHTPEGVIALGQEAADTYATYASDTVRPVELRAHNMDELVNWATERMGRKPVLPDLSKSGYRLMGGRVVSTPHGAGLMLMYDNDKGTRLVMLSRPMVVDQNRTMTPHSEGNVDGWSWASNGMGYSLAGGLPNDALHPLADDIRRQILAQA